MSSSQLVRTPSFFRGVGRKTTNQRWYVSWNFQISIFSIENWYPQSVLGVCETPGFAEFSPFFGIFQVVYYQHGESVGNLYIGKNISTVYDIYIWTSKAIPGTWDFTETRGGYMDVWISQGHMCYFSGCELLNFRGVSDEHMNLLREAKSKKVISLYHLGVSENGVYPKWPFSSGKSVVFSWGILKWVEVEAKALFLNGCFA